MSFMPHALRARPALIPKTSIMDAKTDLGTLREQHLERVYGLFEGKAKNPGQAASLPGAPASMSSSRLPRSLSVRTPSVIDRRPQLRS